MKWFNVNKMQNIYKVIIIGAGPAGLAVANRLSQDSTFPIENTLIIDKGRIPFYRKHEDYDDITCGYGGAGLFSDGKFSFYPSSDKLWLLPDSAELMNSYSWVKSLLSKWNIKVPDFPDLKSHREKILTEAWYKKEYPSYYLSLKDRIELITALSNESDCNYLERTEVLEIDYDTEKRMFTVKLECKHINHGNIFYLKCHNLVLATGRFGPLLLNSSNFVTPIYKRLEVGFRIQQPSIESFFYKFDIVDFKIKYKKDSVEWRTFCACRDGEAILSNTLGIWSVSGHSDCEPSGLSNIGFNTRISDKNLADKICKDTVNSFMKKENYFNIGIHDFLSNNCHIERLEGIYGKELFNHLVKGLEMFITEFPSIKNDTTRLIGPTLEGVGNYPLIDEDLKVPSAPAWIVGDCCGIFRGIVAAFISGCYCASKLIKDYYNIYSKKQLVCDLN